MHGRGEGFLGYHSEAASFASFVAEREDKGAPELEGDAARTVYSEIVTGNAS